MTTTPQQDEQWFAHEMPDHTRPGFMRAVIRNEFGHLIAEVTGNTTPMHGTGKTVSWANAVLLADAPDLLRERDQLRARIASLESSVKTLREALHRAERTIKIVHNHFRHCTSRGVAEAFVKQSFAEIEANEKALAATSPERSKET